MGGARNQFLVGLFEDDPEAAVQEARDSKKLRTLFNTIIQRLPVGMSWKYLLIMADELTIENNTFWFERLVQVAVNNQRRHELFEAMADYEGDNFPERLPSFEYAAGIGVFAPIVFDMKKADIDRLVETDAISRAALAAYFGNKIDHFVVNGDQKRAFDSLVAAAKAFEGWRPSVFEAWVSYIWQAHFEKGLVTDLTDDPKDWRNCNEPRQVTYGIARNGHKGTPKIYKIETAAVDVPKLWLWGNYIEIAEDESCTDGKWRNAHHAVAPPGNMLRDLIWYWHNREKARRLRNFCQEHGLTIPAEP